jgi:DNA protecting protein DprA
MSFTNSSATGTPSVKQLLAITRNASARRLFRKEAANTQASFNWAPIVRASVSSPNLDENNLSLWESAHKNPNPSGIDASLEGLVAKTAEWLGQRNHRLICFTDPLYPPQLRLIDDPPICLYCIGNALLLSQPGIAVVGSRHATALGLETASEFSDEFSRQGFTVISGLARGIDTAAHRGALICGPAPLGRKASTGSTIAVLGNGVDICYPASNQKLYDSIAANGCLISEFPLGYPSLAPNFPKRNRLIAGLSLGCLVVEAARNSGSLITAKLALDYGREVFAVPNSIHSPTGKGCNQLIREGAALVETAEDLLGLLRDPLLFEPQSPLRRVQALEPIVSKTDRALSKKNSAISTSNVETLEETSLPNQVFSLGCDDEPDLQQTRQAFILETIGYAPIALDSLLQQDCPELAPMQLHHWLEDLSELELAGLIQRQNDGRYVRIRRE